MDKTCRSLGHLHPVGAPPISILNRKRTSRAHHGGTRPSVGGDMDMMNTGVIQATAKIYQFPTGGRAALGGRRYGETKPSIDANAPRANLCSGSWYHEAAIQDS